MAVLLPGRAEYLEKMAIPAAGLAARGFSVVSLDWRGQGLSDRLIPARDRGHVAGFTDYHRDIAALLAAPEVAALGPVRLVLAHSMGGTIAIGAVQTGALPKVPLVLSAPLLNLAMTWPVRLAARCLAFAAAWTGLAHLWAPRPDADRPYLLTVTFEDNVLTSDRAVFDWLQAVLRQDPRLALGGPTLGWMAAVIREMDKLRALPRLPVPALVLAGGAESVVDPDAMRHAAQKWQTDYAEIADGLHELLVEAEPMRSQAWAEIDGFLERCSI